MTKTHFLAPAIIAAICGAVLMPAGMAAAATPAPAPSLLRSASAAVEVRMMRRPMMKRGGGRTISRTLGAKRG